MKIGIFVIGYVGVVSAECLLLDGNTIVVNVICDNGSEVYYFGQ